MIKCVVQWQVCLNIYKAKQPILLDKLIDICVKNKIIL